jgi:hypothetical protein
MSELEERAKKDKEEEIEKQKVWIQNARLVSPLRINTAKLNFEVVINQCSSLPLGTKEENNAKKKKERRSR